MRTERVAWRDGQWKLPFFTIWAGQAFSLFGSSLVGFALVWWLTAETGSATILALGTLFSLLPQIALGPLAGTLVDRWNRRRVTLVADSLIALATLLLAALFASGGAQTWHVLALMLIRAAGGAFHWPAMQASTTLMVPDKHLARVAGLNQTLQGLQSIVSPPVGALLYAVLPLPGILLIDVGTALLAIAPLLVIDIPQPERPPTTAQSVRPSVWQDMLDGFRYVRAWPGLLAVIVMAVVLNLLANPAFSLMPLLVTDHFGGGATELGWLESAWGIGMLVGGLTLSVWGGFKRRVLTSLLAIIGQAIGMLILGLAPATLFGLAVAGLFLAGFMSPIVNGPFFAMMQSTIAPEMQGRVLSLVGAAVQAMTPLGLLVIGPLADAIGVRAPMIVAGAVSLVMGAGALFVPAIMTIETNRREVVGAGGREAPQPDEVVASAD